jgi:hypothetical protein
MHHREIHLGSIRLKSETQSEPSLSPYSLWRTTQGPKARNITAQPEGLGSRAERNGRAEGPKHPAPNRCAGLCSERRTTQLSCRHNPRSCTFVQLQHEREFRIAVPTIELRHSERSEEPLDLYFAPARLWAHQPRVRLKPCNSYPFNNLQLFFRDLLENPSCQGVRASANAPSPRESTTYTQKITCVPTLFNLLSLK